MTPIPSSPVQSQRGTDERERLIAERADWLVDAVAGATQNRMFLRGDPECDEVACGAIEANGAKAMRVLLDRVLRADAEQLRALEDKIASMQPHALKAKLQSCEETLRARDEEIAGLRVALREAIDVIHTWHGDVAWDIYANHSPEMKRLNAALQEKSRDAG